MWKGEALATVCQLIFSIFIQGIVQVWSVGFFFFFFWLGICVRYIDYVLAYEPVAAIREGSYHQAGQVAQVFHAIFDICDHHADAHPILVFWK